jgi:hypothetical protein
LKKAANPKEEGTRQMVEYGSGGDLTVRRTARLKTEMSSQHQIKPSKNHIGIGNHAASAKHYHLEQRLWHSLLFVLKDRTSVLRYFESGSFLMRSHARKEKLVNQT